MSISIRRAKPEDAPVCGQICYEAFHKISTAHNFPPDVPAPEGGIGLMTRMFSDPGFIKVELVQKLHEFKVAFNCEGRILSQRVIGGDKCSKSHPS